MNLVVISPERDRVDEHVVLDRMFAAGLERYHVRKPNVGRAELGNWIARVPMRWRSRLVLHQHHDLVDEFCVGGRHWRDEPGAGPVRPSFTHCGRAQYLTSRSCHDLGTLRASLGVYSSVFFGPVFASLSKPGYGPREAQIGEALGAILHTRVALENRTLVIALGGITCETAPRARSLGFDGVAVLGAVWQSRDPLAAFRHLQEVCAPSGADAFIGRDLPLDCIMRPTAHDHGHATNGEGAADRPASE